MLDVICLGEAVVDLISLDKGVRLRDAERFVKRAGGSPANVAAACSKLGLKVGFVGKVGSDELGRFLKGELAKRGVDVKHLMTSSLKTPLALVSLDEKGDRSFEFYGLPSAALDLRPEELPLNYLREAKLFHFSSFTLAKEPSRSATLEAANVAREAGSVVTFDPNFRLGLWESTEEARSVAWKAVELCSVAKMNEEELELLTGLELERGVASLLERGVEVVFVTLGDKGCFYASHSEKGFVPSFEVEVVDATGAGDAFMAGVIYGILKGLPLQKIALHANAAGAIAVTKAGAMEALPTIEELESLVARRGP